MIRVVVSVSSSSCSSVASLGSPMGNAAEYAEIVRRLGKGELRPIVDRVYPMDRVREAYDRLAKGELRPIVDGVYPLERARAAYERLAKAQQLGKVVVEVAS